MCSCDSTQKIERFEEEKQLLRTDFMEEDNEHSKRNKDKPRNDKNKENSRSHGDLLDKEVCFVPHRCSLFLFYLIHELTMTCMIGLYLNFKTVRFFLILN